MNSLEFTIFTLAPVMKIIRIFAFFCFFAVISPWTSLEAFAVIAPDSMGTFQTTKLPNSYTPKPKSAEYAAPENIGTAHTVSMPRNGYIGKRVERTYHSLGPTDGPERPVIVLLHGAGRNGRAMLDMWQHLAEREDIILLAPDALAGANWTLMNDAAFIAEEMIEDAMRHLPIDSDRIFLAGHSDGGMIAMRLANLGIGPWKAVEIHAATIATTFIVPALNAIPVQIHIGDNDHVFPLDLVRNSAMRLAKAGHDVELVEMSDHTHWYYAVAPRLSLKAWAFFDAAQDRLTAG